MDNSNKLLCIAYINIHGQTGLTIEKQLQIENSMIRNDIDICHCQEIHVEENTFEECTLLSSSYNITSNSSDNRYSTASLVKNCYNISNINLDIDGKVIIFDIENITIGNIYLPSGTDAISRSKRESLLSETIPRMLINRQMSRLIGGDWNCILNKEDATNYPEQKLSPSLVRLVKTFSFQDSYRILYPSRKCFSRYYETKFGGGASRLDRNYQYGQIMINEAKYESIAFSDHMAHILKINIPECIMKCKSPKSRPLFKTIPEVVLDEVFHSRLKGAMEQLLDSPYYPSVVKPY